MNSFIAGNAVSICPSVLIRFGAVCFLECDVGQTEFTPPALLSLNKVTSPLLGKLQNY